MDWRRETLLGFVSVWALVVAASVLADEGVPTVGDASGTTAGCARCREVAELVATDPRLAPGTRATTARRLSTSQAEGGQQDTWEFVLERPGCPHRGRVTVEHPAHRVRSFTAPRADSDCTQAVRPQDELQRAALSFAREHFASVWQRGHDVVQSPLDTTIWFGGVVRFEWQALCGDVALPLMCMVEVSVWDARVVGGQLTDIVPTVPIVPGLSREQAVGAGRAAAAVLAPNAGALVLYEARCGVEVTPGGQRLAWNMMFGLSGPEGADGQRCIAVSVNALDGTVREAEMVAITPEDLWRLTKGQRGRPLVPRLDDPRLSAQFEEVWPTWLSDGKRIVFASSRGRPGRPPWRDRAPGVFVVDGGGTGLKAVDLGVNGPASYPSPSPDGLQLLTVQHDDRLFWLDLLSGAWRMLTASDRPAGTPSWEPDSSSVVFNAFRRQGDVDIFECGLRRESGTLMPDDRLRLVHLPGVDWCPLFSPDGRQVYFAHCAPGAAPKGEEWSVYRVPPDKQYWENAPPELVVGGFGAIGRLSFFPDGRLLVWHDKGLDVVDVEAKTRAPLELPELRDPELPAERPALKLRDPAVSPDGKKLAFSGYRDSGDPQNGTGWYIYTCNLDGSDVKRVTPLADDPVEPYVFPQTGKTALDVAREMEEQAQKLVGGSD